MARLVYVSNGTAPQIQHNACKDIQTIQLQPPSLRISALRMSDRDSFFRVCFLLISMLNVSRHFLKIQLVSLCLKRDAIHVDEVMLAC